MDFKRVINTSANRELEEDFMGSSDAVDASSSDPKFVRSDVAVFE